MTNEQIIFSHRMALMQAGVIGDTGEMIIVKDADGNNHQVKEPEQIHTFMEWKKRGYKVKHGAKAVSKFPIWKHTAKKPADEGSDATEKLFMKTAFFFTQSQVERAE